MGDTHSGTAAVAGISATINGLVVTAHVATGSLGAISIDNLRFWCPNCRWDRVVVGRCKAGRQTATSKGKGKEKSKEKGKKRHKRLSGETIRPGPSTLGIDDETAESVAEFEELISRGGEVLSSELNDDTSGASDGVPMADPASIPAPPPLPPPMQARIQGPITGSARHFMASNTNANNSNSNNNSDDNSNSNEERDLDRISAMVDDLQTRIERLRVVYASRRSPSEQSDGAAGGASGEASETVDRDADEELLLAEVGVDEMG